MVKGNRVIIFIANYQSQTPRKQAGADTQYTQPAAAVHCESGCWKSEDSLHTVVLNCVTFRHGTNVKYAPLLEPISFWRDDLATGPTANVSGFLDNE